MATFLSRMFWRDFEGKCLAELFEAFSRQLMILDVFVRHWITATLNSFQSGLPSPPFLYDRIKIAIQDLGVIVSSSTLCQIVEERERSHLSLAGSSIACKFRIVLVVEL